MLRVLFYIVWSPVMLIGLLSLLITIPWYFFAIAFLNYPEKHRIWRREYPLVFFIWTCDYIPSKFKEGWKL
jgi:hypothetical protein